MVEYSCEQYRASRSSLSRYRTSSEAAKPNGAVEATVKLVPTDYLNKTAFYNFVASQPWCQAIDTTG